MKNHKLFNDFLSSGQVDVHLENNQRCRDFVHGRCFHPTLEKTTEASKVPSLSCLTKWQGMEFIVYYPKVHVLILFSNHPFHNTTMSN
jgi:hypothetical protein